MPRVSLVLSTYEKPRELALSLESIAAAGSCDDLEVLVADDGSGPATGEVIERFSRTAPLDVVHVRHEDRGFRLAAIRNRAILRAGGDVLVFVDGDSLVDARAIPLHAQRVRPGLAHVGSRCQLDERLTARLLAREVDGDERRRVLDRELRRAAWGRWWSFVKNRFYARTGLKVRPKLIGGNCAVHRTDLEAVNGWDERFVGWGLEDDDLGRRLRRRGVRIVDGARDCSVFHLFHLAHPSHRPTVRHASNYRYFHRSCVLTRCRHGLRRRALQDVAFDVRGNLPPALAALRARLGAPRGGDPAEVVLLCDGVSRPRAGEADAVLELSTLLEGDVETALSGDEAVDDVLRKLDALI